MTLICRIRLLGSVQIETSAGLLQDFRSRKALALLSYLARHKHPVGRSHLADLLWGGQPEGRGRRNLSRELAYLSTILLDCFEADRDSIRFTPPHACWIDTNAFDELAPPPRPAGSGGDQLQQTGLVASGPLASRASEDLEGQAARLAEAATLYRGDFMAGFSVDDCPEFEMWLLGEQEVWRQRVTGIFDCLTVYYGLHRQENQALLYARRWLELEPWQEVAHQHLMRLLARTGQRSAALAQFAACRRILADELGVEPAAETVELYEQIRTSEGGRERPSSSSPPPPTDTLVQPSPLQPPAPAVEMPGRSALRLHSDWGEAPDVSTFYGRKTELAQLQQWLATEQYRLVAILGIGGQGKTTLAAKTAKDSEAHFDIVIWRSLLNAPPLAQILENWLQILSNQQLTAAPTDLDSRLGLLFEQLRQYRCLLILDNAESLMQEKQRAGEYRPGYEDYGQLIRRFGEGNHQSCLLLTSRERPKEFTRLEREPAPVKSLQLTGLDLTAGQAILQEKGLTGPDETTQALINRYSGNPLALILVADTVRELFDGDITAFLSDETAIFEDIQDVLNQQFGRLTALERAVMVWLAIEREPVCLQALADDLVPTPGLSQLLEAVRSLQRRSLIEKYGEGWSSQNVVTEYVTDNLVRRVCQEIEQEKPDWFNRHALIKAQAREYVRQSQERLILTPVAEWLAGNYGLAGVEAKLKRLLSVLRLDLTAPPGYAGGNILNLLVHLKIDDLSWDFSGLTVWQAYLRGKTLQKVNLARTDLRGSEFTDTFGKIYDVACSPDGQLLAGATDNNQIRLWQVASGRPVASLAGHTEFVTSVDFSPDGTLLASGSDDLTTCVWDVQTGQRLKIFRVHTAYVSSVSFSPDGAYLASGSLGCLSIWDRQTDEMLALRFKPTDRIEAATFSPDGRSLAVNFEETIQVWDVAATLAARREQVRHTLRGHTALVRSFAFHPDGQLLASAGRDQTIRLWSMASGQCLATLRGHTGSVRAVAFSPDGTLLASGSIDQMIRWWDGQTGEALITLSGHRQMVISLVFSPDGQLLFSSSEDQTIGLWDVPTGQRLRTIQGYNNPIHAVAVSPDGAFCASGSEDQGIRLWDTQQGQCSRILRGHDSLVRRVAFSPDGTLLASCGYDGTVRSWTTATGQIIFTLPASLRRVTDLAYSPDGRFLAAGGDDGLLRVWYADTGQALHTLSHSNTISALAFHSNSEMVASVSFDFNIYLWDVRTGQLIRTLDGHENEVWGLCFNPEGNLLASSSDDHTVRLWEFDTGQCRYILRGQTGWMQGLAFSPEGDLLAGASRDGTVWLWAVKAQALEAGQPFRKLSGHLDTVTSVAFNPTTGHLVSGSLDETIRLWDTQSGECLDTWRPPSPYAGMNIAGATGLTPTQRLALKKLGAVEL